MEDNLKEHNKSILKHTTLLGGSSLITILLGMIRTKFVAVLLGPSGVGYMGVLTSLQQTISTVTGLGLSSSGVRQIAFAIGKKDEKSALIIVKSLKYLAWITGVIGLLVLVFGAKYWSIISFKTTEYILPIAFLGFAVLFSSISTGQSCLLQGFRRISDVAKINIIGAFSGIIIGLPCLYLWGKGGVVPSIVLASLVMLVTSVYYSHKIKLDQTYFDSYTLLRESNKLIKFGFPIMASGVITTASSYFIRIYLTRAAGLDAVGQYQAAFGLAGVLVNFVLGAMGTDYYPRLTAVAEDNNKINYEVNSQTQIALLLAVPALGATIVFMPFIITLFYSSKFNDSIKILRWAILGVLGRVISWPMGFVLLAKAKGAIFFITEFITGLFNILLFICCFKHLGLEGSGLAFALLYLWHIVLMYLITLKIADTKWNHDSIKLIFVSILFITILSILQLLKISISIKYFISSLLLAYFTYEYIKKLMNISGISFSNVIRKIFK